MKTTRMIKQLGMMVAAAMLGAGLVGCSSAQGSTPAEKRAYVDNMAVEALDAFYDASPELKSRVNNAPGYGLFSKIGTNLIFVTTEGGHGKVHNNQTGDDTYMKVAGGGVGIGLGVKDYKLLMIFRTESAMNDFVENGWSAGADADAAAKAGDSGGEASAGANVEGDIETHVMTENGLALSATISGTKFWKDDDLN